MPKIILINDNGKQGGKQEIEKFILFGFTKEGLVRGFSGISDMELSYAAHFLNAMVRERFEEEALEDLDIINDGWDE